MNFCVRFGIGRSSVDKGILPKMESGVKDNEKVWRCVVDKGVCEMKGRMKNIEGWRKGYKVRFLTMPRAEKCKPIPSFCTVCNGLFQGQFCILYKSGIENGLFPAVFGQVCSSSGDLGGFGLAGFCGRFSGTAGGFLLSFLPRSLSSSLPLSISSASVSPCMAGGWLWSLLVSLSGWLLRRWRSSSPA